MSGRMFGFAAMLVTLVVIGVVAVGHQSSRTAGPEGATALCQDISRFTATMRDIRSGTVSTDQELVRLGQAHDAFLSDAQREQNPDVAAHITGLAGDISDWQASVISGDAVDEDIAINRVLSELVTLPAC